MLGVVEHGAEKSRGNREKAGSGESTKGGRMGQKNKQFELCV